MKIQFNEAQLSRPQRESLLSVLDVLQSENRNEIEVTPIEFPLKFRVKLDDNIEMVVGWNPESDSYAGLTKPEPEPDPIPESEKDTVDLPGPDLTSAEEFIKSKNEELVKSEIGQRVDALAAALVKLAMPFESDRRLEIWNAFCNTVLKELWK